MVTPLDYLEHIRYESNRFGFCLTTADPAARVPTCPDWTAADFAWHLAEVQLFWTTIVRNRLHDPDAAEAAKPERPDDYAELLNLFDSATEALIDTLASTPGDTEVWTWADDHRVDFVLRRQAHEALIHRLDAELVAADPSPIDRDLASDGVDEVLRYMHGDRPSWGTFTPEATIGAIETSDTLAAWRFEFGRFVGTGPDSGNLYDLDTIAVVDGPSADPVFTARATAEELDRWLWARGPVNAVAVDGDRDAFTRLEMIVSRGID